MRPLLSKVTQGRALQSFLKFMVEKLLWALFTSTSIFFFFSQLVYKFSSSFHRKEAFKVFNPFFKLSFFHCIHPVPWYLRKAINCKYFQNTCKPEHFILCYSIKYQVSLCLRSFFFFNTSWFLSDSWI